MKLINIASAEEAAPGFELMLEFRPNLEREDLKEKLNQMLAEGYKLVYCVDETDDKIAGFIGFRHLHMLLNGRIVYIDDLFVLSQYRGRGYAGALLDHVHQQAEKEGLDAVHLDSGPTRTDAHRLYLNKGYTIRCMHFARKLN
jgi:GNAT superfamily N-acetyltransferase